MKRKFLPLLLTVVLVVAAAIVPMLTLTASAADVETTIQYKFSDYDAGTQYAVNEVHELNEYLTVVTTHAHFTTQLRLYSSDQYNGNAVLKSTKDNTLITGLVFNAGNKVDTLNVYGSNDDGASWDLIEGVSITATAYKDYEVNFNSESYKWLKLDVAGSNQVRVANITVTFLESVAGDETCEHTNTTTTTTPATKTEDGSIVVTCVDCGYEVSEEKIPALGCTVDFVVPAGVTVPSSQSGVLKVTMPAAPELVGSYAQDYTFAGWAKAAIDGDTNVRPTLYAAGETVELTDDTTFYAVYSYEAKGDGTTSNSAFELNNNIVAGNTVVITVTTSNGTYALSNNNGTSKAPAATKITVVNGQISGEVADTLQWTVGGDANGYIFYVAGSTKTWLYCTATNNGVRVGTNTANTFVVDSKTGYLKHNGTSRYLGVYNSQDWRCYTNTTGNTANQTLGFYVLSESNSVTYYTSTLETSECDHANAEIVTVPATCTENGSITTTCSCGYTSVETISATGHSYDDGVVTTDPTCTEDGEKTYTCQNGDCGHTYTEKVDATGHNYVDGSCDVCGEAQPEIKGTRYYIAAIRSSGNYFWMTSDLGTASTKRYTAVDSGLTSLPESITAPEVGYVFILIDNGDGTYCLCAEGVEGDNYLGWTSGNSGILVAESDALKFTVDVKEDGTYNMHFAGDVERYLALNGTSGNNYFAWYKSGQKQDLTLVPVVEKEPVTEPTFKSSSIYIGTDLSMNYYIVLPDGADASEYTVQFGFNGKTYTVALVADGDMYKATLADIGPQNYELTITANLLLNDESVLAAPEYSINASLTGYINGDYDDKTKALAEATLAYCAAAKAYVSDEITSTEKVKGTVAKTDKSITNNNVKVTAVGVNFDYVNKIYVKLNDKASVKFGNNDAVNVTDGIAYSNALTALQFNDTVTIVVDGTTTVTYSVNAYAYTIYTKYATAENLTEKQLEMYNLAVTLYNYGAAAEAYNKTAQSAN